jgi:hypothetical protein
MPSAVARALLTHFVVHSTMSSPCPGSATILHTRLGISRTVHTWRGGSRLQSVTVHTHLLPAVMDAVWQGQAGGAGRGGEREPVGAVC